MSDEYKQWYSNKELFEMMQNLSAKLTETNEKISKYNGLRDDLDEACQEVKQLKIIVKLMVWGYGIVGSAFLLALATNLIEIL